MPERATDATTTRCESYSSMPSIRRCTNGHGRSGQGARRMTPFLELRQVTKVFSSGVFHKKRTVALDNLSMTIHTDNAAVRAVAGESGSGKTTLGMILMGFLQP